MLLLDSSLGTFFGALWGLFMLYVKAFIENPWPGIVFFLIIYIFYKVGNFFNEMEEKQRAEKEAERRNTTIRIIFKDETSLTSRDKND